MHLSSATKTLLTIGIVLFSFEFSVWAQIDDQPNEGPSLEDEFEDDPEEEEVFLEDSDLSADQSDDKDDIPEPLEHALDSRTEDESYPESTLVEYSYIKFNRTSVNQYELYPYKMRRQAWGSYVTVSYGNYRPSKMVSPVTGRDYKSGFGNRNGMFELGVTVKWNFSLGSLGLDLGAGLFQVSKIDEQDNRSKMSITQARVGAILVFDTIMSEPYLAPYFLGGLYKAKYSEDLAPRVGDNTNLTRDLPAANYLGTGLMLQLDWIERSDAYHSYMENGVENAFVFIEARQWGSPTGNSVDNPDIGLDQELRLGLRVEL